MKKKYFLYLSYYRTDIQPADIDPESPSTSAGPGNYTKSSRVILAPGMIYRHIDRSLFCYNTRCFLFIFFEQIIVT
jgi:hypothetical protein